MHRHLSSWVGMIGLWVLFAIGYIWNRDNGWSLLTSVVGDYDSSRVSYRMDYDDQTVTLIGDEGGYAVLDAMVLYDPDRVSFRELDSWYDYIIENDDTGLLRLRFEWLPMTWNETFLGRLVRSGALESVVVSDIGFEQWGSFYTIPVVDNSLCFGNGCEHDA